MRDYSLKLQIKLLALKVDILKINLVIFDLVKTRVEVVVLCAESKSLNQPYK